MGDVSVSHRQLQGGFVHEVSVQILGGSWDLVSRVISTLIGVISVCTCTYLAYNPNY